MSFRLTIYLFVLDPDLTQSLRTLLNEERYDLYFIQSPDEFINCLEEHKEKIDCLIVYNQSSFLPFFNQLYEEGLLLPIVIISDELSIESVHGEHPTHFYHRAEIQIEKEKIKEISSLIDHAIAQFLHLGPNCSLAEQNVLKTRANSYEDKQSFLLLQQRRLAEKLKERLGYLGVYYKRNPQLFYRNLSTSDKQELLKQLKNDYREIILNYFSTESSINQEIDQFVNQVFFADVSVSQILEIHMELIDIFSQQLKLEGRSEEILLDYRLALIDILAHLGEMYRRSIPREDIPYELLFSLD
ncbi:circadian clock protein KaiA [Aphanothece hegewaldii CCALA 016]|uniref:Circadian clock oscillator protein KaiA n=1 Tax=Aphanothece hegewaldii CCALA 016 TaxID=2107694 RepID=A0A2T1LXX3_9CHRO|nr:circadian clock protein KaiA [Aphanothece hegewaldii]PSF37226.1 circadian clock protein KaiA [Aphanothece hegewaldii CCALA 016]